MTIELKGCWGNRYCRVFHAAQRTYGTLLTVLKRYAKQGERMIAIRIILTITMLISFPVLGCTVPPAVYFYTPEELVENTKSIVLARADSANVIENKSGRKPYFKIVSFKVIEVLRGNKDTETIEMVEFISKEPIYDFGNHELKEFWEEPMAGAGEAPGDCYAYGRYEIGETYLLFSDIGHIKAFEKIKDLKNDKWLSHIRLLAK